MPRIRQDYHRLNINLKRTDYEVLQAQATRDGTTVTSAIKMALALRSRIDSGELRVLNEQGHIVDFMFEDVTPPTVARPTTEQIGQVALPSSLMDPQIVPPSFS